MNKYLSLPLLVAATVAMQAQAGKPDWAGNGHGKNKHEEPVASPAQIAIGNYFQETQRQAVLGYYGKQPSGHCPPGLAKKNNGCQPPGQAKQWQRGQALPGSVMLYPVPPEVLRRIGNPPPGYKFIRVANDILLIAVGSQMVVDAIEDLMR